MVALLPSVQAADQLAADVFSREEVSQDRQRCLVLLFDRVMADIEHPRQLEHEQYLKSILGHAVTVTSWRLNPPNLAQHGIVAKAQILRTHDGSTSID